MLQFQCSSASRKFLNRGRASGGFWRVLFQCSSASRKFLNRIRNVIHEHVHQPFQCSSASRKSSIHLFDLINDNKIVFQCSSASRKSSISCVPPPAPAGPAVSVLFSEPKILNQMRRRPARPAHLVSVLFSEPKILNPDPRTCVHPYFRPR